MKIRFGARCTGMNEPDIAIIEVDEDIDGEKIDEMALDHAVNATGLDYWYEIINEDEDK